MYDQQTETTSKGLKACRNAINDHHDLLREIKYDTSNLKTLYLDNKAVTDNLPHAELKDYLPFDSDNDVLTVLKDTRLNNALYAKVSTFMEYNYIYIYI